MNKGFFFDAIRILQKPKTVFIFNCCKSKDTLRYFKNHTHEGGGMISGNKIVKKWLVIPMVSFYMLLSISCHERMSKLANDL